MTRMTYAGKRADLIVHEREPFNAETPREALAVTPLTPTDAFYVRSHGPVPAAQDSPWRIAVGGLVARELSISLAELGGRRFARTEVVATLQCAGNRRAGLMDVGDIPGEAPWGPGATGTARWGGVRLGDVLAAAQPSPAAHHVAFIGADRSEEADPPQLYGSSIPLDKARRDEVLLADTMNGEPLPDLHGAPVRVVVPGYIGARSVKWLGRIELRREPWDGYYQATVYRLLAAGETPAPGRGIELNQIALNTDFLSPRDGAVLRGGVAELTGYSFAGGERRVGRVDVSADDGATWIQAELLEDEGPWAWRRWRARLELGAGRHELVARAWDTSGATQPERPETVWNPKGYVNNAWARIRLQMV